jgi:hypothetical protein
MLLKLLKMYEATVTNHRRSSKNFWRRLKHIKKLLNYSAGLLFFVLIVRENV